MQNSKKMQVVCLGCAVTAVVATATSALAARPPKNPPSCPDVYAPVICADGNVYSNGCYASIAGQTNCVPYGGDESR